MKGIARARCSWEKNVICDYFSRTSYWLFSSSPLPRSSPSIRDISYNYSISNVDNMIRGYEKARRGSWRTGNFLRNAAKFFGQTSLSLVTEPQFNTFRSDASREKKSTPCASHRGPFPIWTTSKKIITTFNFHQSYEHIAINNAILIFLHLVFFFSWVIGLLMFARRKLLFPEKYS